MVEKIPEGAGQVILANCTNVEISNLNISNVDTGIQLGFSENCTIVNNNVSNSHFDVVLYGSNNSILSNHLSDNRYYDPYPFGGGIMLMGYNNTISNNNYFNNTIGIWLIK